ncbi:MAG: TOBE domain-containing protein [Desulfovibrionaceae bacterium]|nr:TOBE domain-containing protein [Desulfovibrionaceae bacterium]
MSTSDLITIKRLVQNLSSSELSILNEILGKKDLTLANYHRLSSSELISAETWLWERISQATNPKIKLARARIWVIFILLRYGGLKLQEIFNLTWADFDFYNSCINVQQAFKRTIYLSKSIARRLGSIFSPALFPTDQINPLKVDAASIRHTFVRLAKICHLPTGSLNARNLRYSRAGELQRFGLAQPALTYFLGQGKSDLEPEVRTELEKSLQEFCQMETNLRTSARNVFQGRVDEIQESGLMVRVKLKTPSGLLISALITDQSRRRLQITKGTIVTASIKAPWITITPFPKDEIPQSSSMENCFPAVIDNVKGDRILYEISAILPDGCQVCALQGQDGWQPQTGEKVLVLIKALAVVLNTNLG